MKLDVGAAVGSIPSGHSIWESDKLHHETVIAGIFTTSKFEFAIKNSFNDFLYEQS